jgi:hypothetical protein
VSCQIYPGRGLRLVFGESLTVTVNVVSPSGAIRSALGLETPANFKGTNLRTCHQSIWLHAQACPSDVRNHRKHLTICGTSEHLFTRSSCTVVGRQEALVKRGRLYKRRKRNLRESPRPYVERAAAADVVMGTQVANVRTVSGGGACFDGANCGI